MPKLIAVSGMTLTVTPSTVTGTPTVTALPSLKVNAGGSAVYRGSVAISVAAITQGNFVGPTAVGNLQATATKGRADGQFLLREGDKATGLSTAGTDPGSGATTIINFAVEITSAGQLKARSD